MPTSQPDRTRRPFVLADGIAILERTPPTLDALLRGLPDGFVLGNEGGGTWSPFDIIGHLIHGEETDWIARARIILEHGEGRTFDKFDRLAHAEASMGRTLASLLDEFATLRQTNLRALTAMRLTEADLARTGRHPAFGPVTLGQLLATWVAHDLDHVMQISRVLANQYSGRGRTVARLPPRDQRTAGLSRLADRRPRLRRRCRGPTIRRTTRRALAGWPGISASRPARERRGTVRPKAVPSAIRPHRRAPRIRPRNPCAPPPRCCP